jgi:DNA-binding MarR family transcriptional regulator/fluoride ion exporter CrcB/FEX
MEMNSPLILTAWMYAIVLLLIMLAAGVIGGIASYYLSESEDRSKTKSITLGIVAALIVPVFLNMISSNILIEAQKEIDKLFIFAGFCVLASVFSRNFLENIYNKVIQQVGNLEQKLEEAVEEPDLPTKDVSETLLTKKGITSNEFKILNILSSGRYTYRSTSGLRRELDLDKSSFDESLNQLIAKKFVLSRLNKKEQQRYFISGRGREVLGELSIAQDEGA